MLPKAVASCIPWDIYPMFANAFACFAWKCRLTWQLSGLLFIPLTLALSQNLLCQVSSAERFSKCESAVWGKTFGVRRLVSKWETHQMPLKLQFLFCFLPSIPWIVFEYHMLGTELGTGEMSTAPRFIYHGG